MFIFILLPKITQFKEQVGILHVHILGVFSKVSDIALLKIRFFYFDSKHDINYINIISRLCKKSIQGELFCSH